MECSTDDTLPETMGMVAPDVIDAPSPIQHEANCFVHCLPNEILGEIFFLTMSHFMWHPQPRFQQSGHRVSYGGWIFITGVCRRWYTVAVHIPTLWSHLLLPCDKVFIKLLLQRSQDTPLHVVNHRAFDNKSIAEVPEMLQLVLPQQLHRIRTLSLHIHRDAYKDFVHEALTLPAPNLHTLEVDIWSSNAPDICIHHHLMPSLRVFRNSGRDNAPWESLSSMATLQVLDLNNQFFGGKVALSTVLDVLAGVPLLQKLRLHHFVPVAAGELQAVRLKRLEECDLLSTPAACVALLRHITTPPDVRILISYYPLSGMDYPQPMESIAMKSETASPLVSFAIFVALGHYRRTTVAGWKSPVGLEHTLDLDNGSAFRLALQEAPPLHHFLRPLSLLSVRQLHLRLTAESILAPLPDITDLAVLSSMMPNVTELSIVWWPLPICVDALCNHRMTASGSKFPWPRLTTLVLEHVLCRRPDPPSPNDCEYGGKLLRTGLLRRQAGGCAMLDRLVVRMCSLEESDLPILQDCCRKLICENN
ncbi:hypothetical protein NM688_g733 [Phlebia brevispora]|uniref:Uncharacterized protein n=1 Tax=Phlebia brevispora TaxID=194682 RepID=A0ACC1TDN2_9APHY|nr:hypothetical protein NM688_g733 [Phlebia brevispora]